MCIDKMSDDRLLLARQLLKNHTRLLGAYMEMLKMFDRPELEEVDIKIQDASEEIRMLTEEINKRKLTTTEEADGD